MSRVNSVVKYPIFSTLFVGATLFTAACVLPNDQEELSVCKFPYNGVAYGGGFDTDGGTGGEGFSGEVWQDIVNHCSYRTVLDVGGLDPLAIEPQLIGGDFEDAFAMTASCEQALRQGIHFGFDVDTFDEEIVTRNFLRGLHALWFHPYFRPEEQNLGVGTKSKQFEIPEITLYFPSSTANHFAQIPAERFKLEEGQFNPDLVRHFCSKTYEIVYDQHETYFTALFNRNDNRMTLANPMSETSNGVMGKYAVMSTLYHELAHDIADTNHVDCNNSVSILAGAPDTCDAYTGMTYQRGASPLVAAALGGLTSHLPGSSAGIIPEEIAQWLMIQNCNTVMLRPQGMRSILSQYVNSAAPLADSVVLNNLCEETTLEQLAENSVLIAGLPIHDDEQEGVDESGGGDTTGGDDNTTTGSADETSADESSSGGAVADTTSGEWMAEGDAISSSLATASSPGFKADRSEIREFISEYLGRRNPKLFTDENRLYAPFLR